ITPPEIDNLSLHDALPISTGAAHIHLRSTFAPKNNRDAATGMKWNGCGRRRSATASATKMNARRAIRRNLTELTIVFIFVALARSEEHTSELQSRSDLVCR